MIANVSIEGEKEWNAQEIVMSSLSSPQEKENASKNW